MTLTIRRAYEKERSTSGVFRRGRMAGVPVEVYHELDELFRRIQGLQSLVGADERAIAGASGATKTVNRSITLDYSGSASANPVSEIVPVSNPYKILSMTFFAESATVGTPVVGTPQLLIDGQNRLVQIQTFLPDRAGKVYAGTLLTGGAQTSFFTFEIVLRQAGTLQAAIVSVTPNARIKATVEIEERVPI